MSAVYLELILMMTINGDLDDAESDKFSLIMISIYQMTKMAMTMVSRKQEAGGGPGARVRNRRRVLSLSGAVTDPPIFIIVIRMMMMP